MAASETVECGLAVVVEAAQGARERLAAAFASGPVVCVIIRAQGGRELVAAEVRALVEQVQEQGAAALVDTDVRLARTLRADGVHLGDATGVKAAYDEAREILGEHSVVGAYAGKSRHDAMTIAEAGADYIAFGAPAEAQDQESARARRLDLVSWWAEIFEVPCVALDVATPDEAAELASAGADFVAVTLGAGLSAADAADRIAGVRAAMTGKSLRRL